MKQQHLFYTKNEKYFLKLLNRNFNTRAIPEPVKCTVQQGAKCIIKASLEDRESNHQAVKGSEQAPQRCPLGMRII